MTRDLVLAIGFLMLGVSLASSILAACEATRHGLTWDEKVIVSMITAGIGLAVVGALL